jgi:hypothetical protein
MLPSPPRCPVGSATSDARRRSRPLPPSQESPRGVSSYWAPPDYPSHRGVSARRAQPDYPSHRGVPACRAPRLRCPRAAACRVPVDRCGVPACRVRRRPGPRAAVAHRARRLRPRSFPRIRPPRRAGRSRAIPVLRGEQRARGGESRRSASPSLPRKRGSGPPLAAHPASRRPAARRAARASRALHRRSWWSARSRREGPRADQRMARYSAQTRVPRQFLPDRMAAAWAHRPVESSRARVAPVRILPRARRPEPPRASRPPARPDRAPAAWRVRRCVRPGQPADGPWTTFAGCAYRVPRPIARRRRAPPARRSRGHPRALRA